MQIPTRKSEIDRVEVWTRTTGSEEDMIVRVQGPNSDNTGPVEPTDTKSDVARRTLSHEFLSPDGFTMFILPDHTLPPRSNAWLIIETEGSSGQEVGVDSTTGDLTHRFHYPYPINVRVTDGDSQDEYRRRDYHIDDDDIPTFAGARDRGQAFRQRHAEPDIFLGMDARSQRFHDLRTGDVVKLDLPDVSVHGNHVVTERDVTYEENRLQTDVTLRDVASL